MPLRRAPENSKDLPVMIWWDIDNVGLPRPFEANKIAGRIQVKLAQFGYTGEISIKIIGGAEDKYLGHRRLALFRNDAAARGIKMTVIWKFHVGSVYTKAELKDVADEMLVVNLTNWLGEHQAPQNVIIIGGDHNYYAVCKLLFKKKINVALVYVPNNVDYALLDIFEENTLSGLAYNTSEIQEFLQ